MSEEDNVVEFPTTGNMEEGEGKLKEVAEQGDAQVLTVVNQNRKNGVSALEQQLLKLEDQLNGVRLDVLTDTTEGKTAFNLVNTLRTILKGMQNALTTLEASNSLADMMVHDLAGCIQNLEQIGGANWQTGAHQQVLIEVLKAKGLIEEDDMKAMWNRLIPDAVKAMKEQAERN